MKIMLLKDRNVLNTRFVVQFANNLAETNDVHVVCDSYRKPGKMFSFSKNVKYTNIGSKTNNYFLNIIRLIRTELKISRRCIQKFISQENPDVIICYFPTDLNNAIKNSRHNIPTIQMFHCYPESMFNNLKKKSVKKYNIFLENLKKVSAIQILNSDFINNFPKQFKNKIYVIPNIVDQIDKENRANLHFEKKRIIYVARIEKKGKRQHLLIDAFANANKEFPEWNLELWGLAKSKKYLNELKTQVKNLNLEDKVFFKGFSNDINSVYKNADIIAFPSKEEGFGLGLAEAMSHGLPAIGFKSAPSINKLIINDKNGFLASNNFDFEQKLKKLIQEKDTRIRLGSKAVDDMKKYNSKIILKKWIDLIKNIKINK